MGYTGKRMLMKIFQRAQATITAALIILIVILTFINLVILRPKQAGPASAQPAQTAGDIGIERTKYNTLGNIVWQSYNGRARNLEIADGMSLTILGRLIHYELTPQGVIGYYRLSDGGVIKTHIDRLAKTAGDFARGAGLTLPWGTGLDDSTREEARRVLDSIKQASLAFPAVVAVTTLSSQSECLKTANPDPAICRRMDEYKAAELTPDEFEQDIRRMGRMFEGDDPSESTLSKIFGPGGGGGAGLRPQYIVSTNGQRPQNL